MLMFEMYEIMRGEKIVARIMAVEILVGASTLQLCDGLGRHVGLVTFPAGFTARRVDVSHKHD